VYVIDVNTCFGRRTEFDYDLSLGTLLESLDSHAVAGALTYSLRGVHYDPQGGNAETLAAAQAHPHLIPVATMDLREYLNWEANLGQLLRQRCRVFRFFPRLQGWSISSLFFRQLLEWLQGRATCLIFSTGEGGGWGQAEEIAHVTAQSGLPVILTDVNYNNMAEVITVMRAYPHVYAETNWLATIAALEVMADQVGADRLLYGSGAPMHPMQKAFNEVLESALPTGDKQAILGGNALRLLGLPAERLRGRPQLTDLEPKRFQEEIIDVHSHLGYWRWPIPNENYDPTLMLQRMRRFGISHSVLSSYEGMRYDIVAGNRAVAEAIAGHPELLGYVELNPHQLEQSCAEMDKYYLLPNFVGAELELTHTVQPTGSGEVRALMAEVGKRGRPILFMPASTWAFGGGSGDVGDAQIERALARENPNLTIIHAHSMDANWARVVADTPNIYTEFCLSRPSVHHIRDCLRILGPERLLFGTDQTLLTVGGSVGLYLDAGLDERERRLILRENARRIFGL
jgi:predicted TIM-barrel fold metal-dependent hydrolase